MPVLYESAIRARMARSFMTYDEAKKSCPGGRVSQTWGPNGPDFICSKSSTPATPSPPKITAPYSPPAPISKPQDVPAPSTGLTPPKPKEEKPKSAPVPQTKPGCEECGNLFSDPLCYIFKTFKGCGGSTGLGDVFGSGKEDVSGPGGMKDEICAKECTFGDFLCTAHKSQAGCGGFGLGEFPLAWKLAAGGLIVVLFGFWFVPKLKKL